jgi:hypothetical protein
MMKQDKTKAESIYFKAGISGGFANIEVYNKKKWSHEK